MVTYRKYSQTDSAGYPRLGSCPPPKGRGYSQTTPIAPAVLAGAGSLSKAASAALPEDFTLKAPTVPGAPEDLPPGFDMCVQENGMFIRHTDTSHRLHGADVSKNAVCFDDEESGLRMCRLDVGGDDEMIVPACIDEDVAKDPLPQICCVDIETSTLVCPGSAYDGLVVEIIEGLDFEVEGVAGASVQHPDLPGGGARLPICEKLEPEEEEPPCCINEQTGRLLCHEGSVLAPYNGTVVPARYLECEDSPSGGRICRVKCGVIGEPANDVEEFLQHICQSTGRKEFPVCDVPGAKELSPVPVPKKPPKRVPVPQLCCFNPETSSLVCEGTPYDGLVVELVTETTLPDGTHIASVSHPSLPGGGARMPICPGRPPQRRPIPERPPVVEEPPPPPPPTDEDIPEPETPRPDVMGPCFLPPHCCYSMKTGRLQCAGTEWDGLTPLPISIGHIHEGMGMILLEHPQFIGGRASIPLCPGSCDAEPVHHCGVSDCPRCTPGGDMERRYGAHCDVCGGPHERYACPTDNTGRRYSGFSGRPSVLAAQHEYAESIKHRNKGFSRNSQGWKPDIRTLHQARLCPSPWGPLGHQNPPNSTGNDAGYNVDMWQSWDDVSKALADLGYVHRDRPFDFSAAVREFQSDYNKVTLSMNTDHEAQGVEWARVPKGHVTADGYAGPLTLNALEIAILNQRAGLIWEQVVLLALEGRRSTGRERMYNARGW